MTDITDIIENKSLIATLLVVMFLLSGVNKFSGFNSVVESLKQKLQFDMSNELYNLAIVIVILIEIIAPLVIVYYTFTGNYKEQAYYSVVALIVFTILATFIYHFPDFSNYKKSIPFWANISLLGGLLLLAKMVKT
jgi:uncharacterized membrane protein YphA (DoxX/SURF4 family)